MVEFRERERRAQFEAVRSLVPGDAIAVRKASSAAAGWSGSR